MVPKAFRAACIASTGLCTVPHNRCRNPATGWISEVPGFAKQIRTPAAASERVKLSAPFIS